MLAQNLRPMAEKALVARPIHDSTAVLAVERLLDRHGVPHRKRTRTLTEVLGLHRQAALRRLSGEAEWSIDELERLARRYGESLSELFGAAERPVGAPIPATLTGAPFSCVCVAEIGEVLGHGHGWSLVAWREGDRWCVGARHPESAVAYAVRSLKVAPVHERPVRVAVLDDDFEYGSNLVEALSALGLPTDLFGSSDAFLAAVREHTYDAFVVDWLLADDVDAEATCRELRRISPTSPVVLLTGQLNNAHVSESRLLQAAETLALEPAEKTTRLSFLVAKLQRGMHARGAEAPGS